MWKLENVIYPSDLERKSTSVTDSASYVNLYHKYNTYERLYSI